MRHLVFGPLLNQNHLYMRYTKRDASHKERPKVGIREGGKHSMDYRSQLSIGGHLDKYLIIINTYFRL